MDCMAIFMLIFVLNVFSISAMPSRSCPEKELLRPSCSCKPARYRQGSEITCTEIHNEQDLIEKIKHFNDYKIHSFKLQKSILRYLPGGLFLNQNLRELHFYRVTFQKLLPHDNGENLSHILSGTEESLLRLSITENSYEYSLLDLGVELKELRELHIVRGELSHIGYLSDFSPNVEELTIDQQNANNINETAFSKMLKLKRLELTNNQISSIKRTMLPRPANNLYSLDFHSNHLRSLPEDMFEEMPKLEILILQDNKFHTLDEKVMKPVWGRLKVFSLKGNDIICDEQIEWITTTNTSAKDKGRLPWGECFLPSEHKGKKLECWKNESTRRAYISKSSKIAWKWQNYHALS